MEQFKFLVTNSFGDFPENTKNTILLSINNWNDFGYVTLFGINYVNYQGKVDEIGTVRIARVQQKIGTVERVLNIGDTFEKLDKNFFSLGTEDTYYDNLNSISEELKDFVLYALNDIAIDDQQLNRVINEEVTQFSLLRDLSYSTVVNQFRRIANGGARLTNYSFIYSLPKPQRQSIEFNIVAEQNPPTNIHTIIGSNGAGKSHLLNNMIIHLLNPQNFLKEGSFTFKSYNQNENFSNLICISFSTFDEYDFQSKNSTSGIKYHYIGSKYVSEDKHHTINNFAEDFTTSIESVLNTKKINRWKSIVMELESDPIFRSEDFIGFITDNNFEMIKDSLNQKFRRLSSGHKVILFTITKMVELLQEKSLVFFDEPETHLHPPLLSSFIRALSKLLINRNAVCIMTTHSPIVLQEVPKSCIYKLTRMGEFSKFERPQIETFGENIGVLTNEIFGLEITEAGYYKLLKEIVSENDNYEGALHSINDKLGIEGKSILRSLFYDKLKK
ncbi:AAA family ATPase [Flavobacterium sp. I3-2]|uniref:AAA family ATPase n=1 Tax=Flavobacterium sp. I3-2 TaxID=2748319 RepID=UPI0015AD407F|nr:AAA family ATPase [Flavobacterium sp. I3-2]